ncbi:hypothetical protein L7F22_020333 [Adiantum nelumboides]|nr:hypothetical protein [Adiantum nelumboides]
MVKGDALLIVKQILGIWACKNERLREKFQAIRRLFNQFEEVQLYHIPRKQNEVADLLAQKAVACNESEVQVILAATAIKQPRYQGMESLAPIVSYILEGEFPQSFTKAQKQRLMEKVSSYLFLEGALYQRGKDQVCRRIPTVEEIPSILEGLHEEACGGHFAQELTAKKILLSGYVWPSLHIDVQHWCKSCHNCQVNGNKHLLHGPRQLLLANGPFEKWGIDAMGPLPRTKNGKLYILVAIDYMTRWVETQSVTRVNEKTVSRFVYTHICCRFGTPLEIVSDNGSGFRKGLLTEVCEELHILHRHSTPYYPQSNGLVEKANGIIAGIIRKMVKNKTKLWDDFLDGALWAYRTTYKEDTEFTPFHLVYGQEALQPIELNIPTMRLHGKAAQRKEEEWTDRLLTLAELEWKREAAYECYKRKATQVKDKLDKEVKDKGIKEGDLVLRYQKTPTPPSFVTSPDVKNLTDVQCQKLDWHVLSGDKLKSALGQGAKSRVGTDGHGQSSRKAPLFPSMTDLPKIDTKSRVITLFPRKDAVQSLSDLNWFICNQEAMILTLETQKAKGECIDNLEHEVAQLQSSVDEMAKIAQEFQTWAYGLKKATEKQFHEVEDKISHLIADNNFLMNRLTPLIELEKATLDGQGVTGVLISDVDVDVLKKEVFDYTKEL